MRNRRYFFSFSTFSNLQNSQKKGKMKINPILRRNTYMLSWETFFFVGEMRNELNKIKVNADLTLFFWYPKIL